MVSLPGVSVQGDHKLSSQWKQKPLVAVTSEIPTAQVSRTPAVDGPDPLILDHSASLEAGP